MLSQFEHDVFHLDDEVERLKQDIVRTANASYGILFIAQYDQLAPNEPQTVNRLAQKDAEEVSLAELSVARLVELWDLSMDVSDIIL